MVVEPYWKSPGRPSRIRSVVLAGRARQDQLDVPPGEVRVGASHEGGYARDHGCRRGRAAEVVAVAVVVAGGANRLPASRQVAGRGAEPQVGALLRVGRPLAQIVDRADRGHAVVVGELAEVGVVPLPRPAAAREGVENALAAESGGNANVNCKLPQRRRAVEPRPATMSKAIVGDGRVRLVAGHRVHQVEERRKADEVIAVDRRSGSDAAAAETVVAGRDNAGYPRAVVEVPLEHAASERVVVVPAPVDVVLQVLVLVVQAIVDHGHVDSGAEVAPAPHVFDVDVLSGRSSVPSGIVQVPLAAVQGVVVVGRYGGTAVDKRGVLDVFVRHYGVGPGVSGVVGGHLDVARPAVQAPAEEEAQAAGDVVSRRQMRVDRPAAGVEQLAVRVHRGADDTHDHVGGFGDRHAEVVRVACPVYPASGQGVPAKRQWARGPRAAARRDHLDGGHRVRPGFPAGVLLLHDVGAEVPLADIEVRGKPPADLIPALQRVAPHPQIVHPGVELLANQKMPAEWAVEEAVVVDDQLVAVAVQQRALRVDSLVGARHADHQVRGLRQLYPEVVLVARDRVQYAAGDPVERQADRVGRAGGVLHGLGVQRVGPGLRRPDPDVVRPRIEVVPKEELGAVPPEQGVLVVGLDDRAAAVSQVSRGVQEAGQVARGVYEDAGCLGQRHLEIVVVAGRAYGPHDRRVQANRGRRAARVAVVDGGAGGRRGPRAVAAGDNGAHLHVVLYAVSQPDDGVIEGAFSEDPDVLLDGPIGVCRLVCGGLDMAQVVCRGGRAGAGCPGYVERAVARGHRIDRRGRWRLRPRVPQGQQQEDEDADRRGRQQSCSEQHAGHVVSRSTNRDPVEPSRARQPPTLRPSLSTSWGWKPPPRPAPPARSQDSGTETPAPSPRRSRL